MNEVLAMFYPEFMIVPTLVVFTAFFSLWYGYAKGFEAGYKGARAAALVEGYEKGHAAATKKHDEALMRDA